LSLKKNIASNYVSQLYVTVIGIALVPLYVKYMGAEAYGLVGFFAMLQAWFNMLDLGLSPTIARESARYHGGALLALDYRRLFRALSVIFAIIALVGGGALWCMSQVIATRWLNFETLPLTEVVLAVQIMAISVALRWMSGLYRGVLSGAERHIWLSAFTALIATLRFVCVMGSMWLWGFTPSIFFIHQLAVALLEVGGLYLMSRKLLPAARSLGEMIGWSLLPVRPRLKFALTIAFTSSVWVLVTQTDKLILSGILPLAEYGYFTLAVMVASGIMVISGPVGSVIMPRMARLHAEGQHDELIRVYRSATQLVTAIAGAAAITVIFCAEPFLYAWSGNSELAANSAPILRLYAIGNGILIVGAFPYYLQYAKGDLRYHLIVNIVTGLGLIPCVIYAAINYGAIGAGWVWLGFHLFGFLIWARYVHNRLVPGLHKIWIYQDILFILVAPLAINVILSLCFEKTYERLEGAIYVLLIAAISIITSSAMLPICRSKIKINLKKLFHVLSY
jgi:O-antigen/teichoic acid export membrane protein